MLKFSFHNHTNYSDGADTPEDMLKAAINAGFTHFAFTDHAYSEEETSWTMDYLRYEEYAARISSLKRKYKDRIQVLIGIEADWYKDRGTYYSRFELIRPHVDFIVGSVHVLSPRGRNYLIDADISTFEKCLREGYGGNIELMVADYYETYAQMAAELKPDLLAHIDIIKKNNALRRFYDTNAAWVISLEEELISVIKKHGLVTEVNGGGMYRRKNEEVWYPSMRYLETLRRAGVKMTVGLDAHSTDMVSAYHRDSLHRLHQAGFSEIYYFENAVWNKAKLKDCMY